MKKLTLIFLITICSLCALVLAGCEFFEISDSVHRHFYDEWMITKNRTCTEDGERERYCSCGDKQTGVMAALGHDYSEFEEQPASCTEDGFEAYKICLRCGEGTEKIIIPALSHDLESFEAVPATCTEGGHEAYEKCTRCEYDTYIGIPALSHNFGEWIEVKKSTCAEKGEEQRVCLNDRTHVETRSTEKSEHVSGGWITEKSASCEADGLKYKECAVCRTRLITETITATGHKFGDWEEASAPTCFNDGLEKRVCEYDNSHFETNPLNQLTHVLSDWITEAEPSCETDGLNFRECTLCHSRTETEIIAAVGHVEGEWITDAAAGCGTVGAKHIECTVCNKILKTEKTEPLGHRYNDNACENCGLDFGGTKGLSWELSTDGSSYALKGTGSSISGEIVIPEAYNGKPVTSIGAEAFRGNTVITVIIIPESVSVIGENAFSGCVNVVEITFTRTDGWAFYNADGKKVQEVSEEISNPASAATILTNPYICKYIIKRGEISS